MYWHFKVMPRETIILECTEARKEGKQPSRYMASRNKKLQTDPVEKESIIVFSGGTHCTKKLKGSSTQAFKGGLKPFLQFP